MNDNGIIKIVKCSTEKHNRRCRRAIAQQNASKFMYQYNRTMIRWSDWWITKGVKERQHASN